MHLQALREQRWECSQCDLSFNIIRIHL